jgi:hypothetical protein
MSPEEAMKLIRGETAPPNKAAGASSAATPTVEQLQAEVARLRGEVARLTAELAAARAGAAVPTPGVAPGSPAVLPAAPAPGATPAAGAPTAAGKPPVAGAVKPKVYRSLVAIFQEVPREAVPAITAWEDLTAERNFIGRLMESAGGQMVEVSLPFVSGDFFTRRPSLQQKLYSPEGTSRALEAARIVLADKEFNFLTQPFVPEINIYFNRDQADDLQKLRAGQAVAVRGRLVQVRLEPAEEKGKMRVKFLLEDGDLVKPGMARPAGQ